jgi:hypothetical protein
MTDECTRCGEPREYPDRRFNIRLEDYAESTIHTSDHILCVDCWEQVQSLLFGGAE